VIPDEAVEAAAKAIQVEWGITPWGELSYQAEKALAEDPRKAMRFLAQAVIEALEEAK
jgi:hypothetical protein